MAEKDEPKATYLHVRMPAEFLADLDTLAKYHGVPDRTTVVRVLIAADRRRMEAELAKLARKPREKSEKSAR